MLTAYQFALLIAAPIAAAIVGVVVRRTKITEFRRSWINAQRDDLAVVVANVRRFIRNAAGDKPFETWLAVDSYMNDATAIAFRGFSTSGQTDCRPLPISTGRMYCNLRYISLS